MDALRHCAEAILIDDIKNDPEFIHDLIIQTRRIFAEGGRKVTPFAAEAIASALMFSMFSSKSSEILLRFHYPVIDFLVLRDGIKKVVRDALIQEQASGANDAKF